MSTVLPRHLLSKSVVQYTRAPGRGMSCTSIDLVGV